MTAEALEIYKRHLDPDRATLVVNITNTYLDAAPVAAGLASRLGCQAVRLQTPGDYDHNICRTDWMILSRDAGADRGFARRAECVPVADREIVWTDAQSNLFEIMK